MENLNFTLAKGVKPAEKQAAAKESWWISCKKR